MTDADRIKNIEFNRAGLVQAEARRLFDEKEAANVPLPESELFKGRTRGWFISHIADCLRLAVELDRKEKPTEKLLAEHHVKWGRGRK